MLTVPCLARPCLVQPLKKGASSMPRSGFRLQKVAEGEVSQCKARWAWSSPTARGWAWNRQPGSPVGLCIAAEALGCVAAGHSGPEQEPIPLLV